MAAVDNALDFSKPSLPNGPCNYRDVAIGPCGCNQFWDEYSAELHRGSKEDRPNSERSTWCVCGHHACFHLHGARAGADRQHTPLVGAQYPTEVQCDGRCQLQPGLQCNIHKGGWSLEGERPSREADYTRHNRSYRASPASASQRLMRQGPSQPKGLAPNNQSGEVLSQASSSGLPRVPSVCLLSHDRRLRADARTGASQMKGGFSQSGQAITGLGLSLVDQTDRQQSVSSTVPDEINKAPNASFSESEIPSTRANSIRGDFDRVISPPGGAPVDHILEFNRTLQLNVDSDTIPNTYNPDEFIQSATEVATPSNANTPNLAAADQAIDDTRKLLDTLTRLTSHAERLNSPQARPTSAMSNSGAPLLLTHSPSTPQEQLQQALRAGSPQALQKLVSFLNPLHNLLNTIPNVTTTMRELATRVDYLENNSFNHVQPEDLQQQLDTYDGRLLELEHRMDDHDILHQAIDADQSISSQNRRRLANVTESFGSNNSFQSTTSSALILAATDRKDMETEFDGIKDRLDVLEAAAMPSLANPWEVEVILLPWGPDLRGIWFSPEEPMHDPTKALTQDSEEWTQNLQSARRGYVSQVSKGDAEPSAKDGQLSLTSSLALSESESGWSSQAISEWAAGPRHDWLFPKACGRNNVVYKRLKSRGFVRDVTFRSVSAKYIQATLSTAFGDLLEHLKYPEGYEDEDVESHPGLRASFIPLRKVIKESRLRFLTPPEMSSSALWSAQFLKADVMMRIPGGKKRLYVTQREAYLQQKDGERMDTADEMEDLPSSWTWQQIRQLPRYQPDMDSQMENNDEQCQPQVPEADAREACWGFVEAYDLPPISTQTSFNSNHSAPVQLSMRPADHQWRRSITPTSILKNRQAQPISPLSEKYPVRPGHGRSRTLSASVIELAPQGSSKRRFNASPVKQSSVPHITSRTPSASISRTKRRRVAPSASPRADADLPSREQEGQVIIFNNSTTRHRTALPSPFYSSNPGLARSASDVTNRSQRSAGLATKAAPFAYATPYSGPVSDKGGFGDAAGDTEPDDDYYEEEDDDDDGEKSWRGVGDDDENNEDDSDADAGAEMADLSSFSGDESGFERKGHGDGSTSSEEGDDDESAFGAQPRTDDDDDDDDEEIFDTLLGVLQH